ncbi:hypothetical protein QYE76_051841 [Lolium multiflorum]|uniref:Reverse transcriptase domain-containing protein n=1 Tax=Lolium multiflorum TaxID=4521 RepID=A0AAD8WIA9_LOLMU|nr:hypothetical protein QYE76_051841 [Lolium multiflorum]
MAAAWMVSGNMVEPPGVFRSKGICSRKESVGGPPRRPDHRAAPPSRRAGLWSGPTAPLVRPFGPSSSRTMPFGLTNAGATYQRMMQKCLATQIGKNVQVYIDDVVITINQGSSLIDDLKETFDNLDKFCLKLNLTKCSFGVLLVFLRESPRVSGISKRNRG